LGVDDWSRFSRGNQFLEGGKKKERPSLNMSTGVFQRAPTPGTVCTFPEDGLFMGTIEDVCRRRVRRIFEQDREFQSFRPDERPQ
jgi:hypothetical protein